MNRIERRAAAEAANLPVAVIGAGFSGTMMAIHLAGVLPPQRGILLCESGAPCRGPAYGTGNAKHLLNVRAANMSAFPGQPDHFERWLAAARERLPDEVQDTEAGQFASRGLYSRYLSGLLNAALADDPDRVRLVCAEAVDIVPEGAHYRVIFADGATRVVAGVVLAVGNVPAVAGDSKLWRNNPWAADALAGLRPDVPVLIVGTGLTMVDLALQLRHTGFSGPVIAVSRRGLLPQAHRPKRCWRTPDFNAAERASVAKLFARMRREVREAQLQNVDWGSVIDSLRPITAALWRGLPHAERLRFLRHVRPYWDTHRHRLAAPVADELAALRREQFLIPRRGRIESIAYRDDVAEVTLRPHGGGASERIAVQRVINATGLQNAAGADSTLIANLRRRGLVRLDRLAFGLDVTQALQALDGAGAVVPGLWALGPIVRGVFWECIAVPDIRVQAEQLAHQIGATLAAAKVSADLPD